MSNAKHTRGPWVQRGEDILDTDGNCIVTNGKRSSALLGTHGLKERQKVDAENLRLIAAAPELLDALKNANELLTQLMPGVKHIVLQDFGFVNQTLLDVSAAIAKAEGVTR